MAANALLPSGRKYPDAFYQSDEDVDPNLILYSEWMQLRANARKAPVKMELKHLAQMAKLCLVPVFHGGPDPPEPPPVFDPKVHAQEPAPHNPWEVCAQLHCGAKFEELLNSRETRQLLVKERRNVLGVIGQKGVGKTSLLVYLLGAPHTKGGEDAMRVATHYLPKGDPILYSCRVGEKTKIVDRSGQEHASSKRYVTKNYYHKSEFNELDAANTGQIFPTVEPTEGIDIWHWEAKECVVIDTEGMDFEKGIPKPNAPPDGRLWEEAYQNFLPPLIYGISGIIICCCYVDSDYKTYIQRFMERVLRKVRNAARP